MDKRKYIVVKITYTKDFCDQDTVEVYTKLFYNRQEASDFVVEDRAKKGGEWYYIISVKENGRQWRQVK